jgi:transcriptional regulator with XRE-family HTH domain
MNGLELKEIRKKLGLTQEELAKLIGRISTRAVQNWELGVNRIPNYVIEFLKDEKNNFIIENNTSISKRINELIDYKNISINSFAKKVGASNSYFNKLIKNSTTIGSDKLECILKAYPEINPVWLISGKGKMILDDFDAINVANEPREVYGINYQEEYKLLQERVALQQETIEMLREKIRFLDTKFETETNEKKLLSDIKKIT